MSRRTQAESAQLQETNPTVTTASPANSLKIDVGITSTRNIHGDPTRASATVTLNDSFVIKGFRVIRGENGLFVSMPSRKLRDGSYSEICHPITREFAAELKHSVLDAYQVHLAQQMQESQEVGHDLEGPQEAETPDIDPGFAPEMEV